MSACIVCFWVESFMGIIHKGYRSLCSIVVGVSQLIKMSYCSHLGEFNVNSLKFDEYKHLSLRENDWLSVL